nr:uncharacterized protein LOC127328624 [Lolium perenne]
MSGRFDPTRTSKVELSKAQIASRVNFISQAKLPDNWDWGLEPYNRAEMPPVLFNRQRVEEGNLERRRWTSDHVDSADQAGDDESPEADHQAGQGEHNPPPSPHQPEDKQEEEGEATSASVPIRAVPVSMRPPSTSATSSSAPKGKKRASERSTAALEAKVKKQRRMGPKKVAETAEAAIVFSKGGGSRPTPSVVSPVQRQRREPTPQPTSRARTPHVVVPHVVTPLAAGAGSSTAPSSEAPGSGSRSEPARRVGQPTLDDLFPRRTRLLEPTAGAGRGAPGGATPPAAGVGGAAPDVVVLDASSDEAPLASGSAVPSGPAASVVPPPSSEPARPTDADARALVTTKGPAEPPQALAQPAPWRRIGTRRMPAR